ncbi:MAG: glycosyltransferase [Bacteroidia bacterium]|nr:glycosyltransferase [Bacteroidia bacterium]
MITTILTWLFIISAIIQLLVWIGIYLPFALYREPKRVENEVNKVSIVIAARNESNNLVKYLPRILNQNYRSFEIVIANDNSTDDTDKIISNFTTDYSNIRVVDIERKLAQFPGKKHALTKAIETVQNEVLLFTDADCEPASANWLGKMQSLITTTHTVGLGYSPFKKLPGFLNAWVRFEGVYTAIQYFSLALRGLPYMGVGRNLIYKKNLFSKADGFASHQDILSGDDDLFINQVANKDNTVITLDPKTFVYTDSATDWSTYWKQKRRHVSTGSKYQFHHQIILGLVTLSHVIFHLGGFVLIFSTEFAAFFFAGRFLIVVPIYGLILKKLKQVDLLILIPLLDVLLSIYYLILSPAVIFNQTQKWK